jgi:hypothetical protein
MSRSFLFSLNVFFIAFIPGIARFAASHPAPTAALTQTYP